MMTEEEIRQALDQICTGGTLELISRKGPNQVWQCKTCGAKIPQNVNATYSLGSNPHFKPGDSRLKLPFHRSA